MPAQPRFLSSELALCAASVFAQRGYSHASLDHVAAALGVTKGTLYHRFTGKRELFVAALGERVDRRCERIASVFGTPEANAARGATRARLLAEHLGTALAPDPVDGALLAVARSEPELRDAAAAAQAAIQAEVLDVVVAFLREAGREPKGHAEVAVSLCAVADGLALAERAELVPDAVRRLLAPDR